MTRLLCALLLLVLVLPSAFAAETLPEGEGLAAKYPGDEGIRKDKAVVFADNFENYQPTWEGEWPPSWDGTVPPRTDMRARVHAGRYAAELTARGLKPGQPATHTVYDTRKYAHEVPNQPAHASVYTWYDAGTFRGSTGYEQMFARWYVRFAPGFDPADLDGAVGSLVGASSHWRVVAFEAAKPDGRRLYTAGVAPSPAKKGLGPLAMRSLHTGEQPDAQGRYFGSTFVPERTFTPQPGRWYCLEVMLRPNTPGKDDGEQAFWVDGKLAGHWTGLRFRTEEDLKVNGFWLQLTSHNPRRTATMWCDDVVVAQSYIGPMKARPATGPEH